MAQSSAAAEGNNASDDSGGKTEPALPSISSLGGRKKEGRTVC